MKFTTWFLTLLEPSELQNFKIDELLSALNDSSIRKHWLYTMLEEVKEINRRIHTHLMTGKLNEKFEQESARLVAIDWALRQILNSKTSVELGRHHNQADEFDGVAVNPAP